MLPAKQSTVGVVGRKNFSMMGKDRSHGAYISLASASVSFNQYSHIQNCNPITNIFFHLPRFKMLASTFALSLLAGAAVASPLSRREMHSYTQDVEIHESCNSTQRRMLEDALA